MAPTDIAARFEPEVDAETEFLERRDRLAKQMAAVRRRSRRIRTLRFWIPAAIVLLAAFNVGWIVIASVINSLNLYTGAINEIRMLNPHFSGQSSKGDHYTVTGLEAIRRGDNAAIFTLKSPTIDYHPLDHGSSHVTAASGVYNRDTQLITLTGNVVMTPGDSAMVFRTEEAIIDLTKSQIYGNKHVDGRDPTRHIVGESFVIADNGRSVTMSGRGDNQFHYTAIPQK